MLFIADRVFLGSLRSCWLPIKSRPRLGHYSLCVPLVCYNVTHCWLCVAHVCYIVAHCALCVTHVSGVTHVYNHVAHHSSYAVNVLLVLAIILLTAHNVCFMICYSFAYYPWAVAHHLWLTMILLLLTAPHYISHRFVIIWFANRASFIYGVLLMEEQRLFIFKGHSHVLFWFLSYAIMTLIFFTLLCTNLQAVTIGGKLGTVKLLDWVRD